MHAGSSGREQQTRGSGGCKRCGRSKSRGLRSKSSSRLTCRLRSVDGTSRNGPLLLVDYLHAGVHAAEFFD